MIDFYLFYHNRIKNSLWPRYQSEFKCELSHVGHRPQFLDSSLKIEGNGINTEKDSKTQTDVILVNHEVPSTG